MHNILIGSRPVTDPRIVFVKPPKRNKALLHFFLIMIVFPAAVMTWLVTFCGYVLKTIITIR